MVMPTGSIVCIYRDNIPLRHYSVHYLSFPSGRTFPSLKDGAFVVKSTTASRKTLNETVSGGSRLHKSLGCPAFTGRLFGPSIGVRDPQVKKST